MIKKIHNMGKRRELVNIVKNVQRVYNDKAVQKNINSAFDKSRIVRVEAF